jgi:hypothetical protein
MAVSTGTQRPQFSLEAQMAAPVLTWLRQNSLDVKREFSLPWGICDFVGVSFDRKRAQLRISYGQTKSIGTPRRLFLLSKIPDTHSGRSITCKRLQNELSEIMPPEVFDLELNHLIRSNFVHRPRSGLLQSRNGWAPLHKRIIAVELKLSRVTDGFAQARSNLSFATESYVALPSRTARRLVESRMAQDFRKNGIGILAVGSRFCEPVLRSGVTAACRDHLLQAYCVERFWRTKGNCS